MEQLTHLADENVVAILEMVHNTHRREITHHREAQFRVFSWTSSLLLAAAAGLVAIGPRWAQYRLVGGSILTIMVLTICLSTLLLLNRNRDALETNARIVVRVDLRLGLFETGCLGGDDSVYPKAWLEWGSRQKASIETWFYVAATIILSLTVVVAAWVLT